MKKPELSVSPQDNDNGTILVHLNKVDFLIIKLKDIVYFHYNSDCRYWEAVITNSSLSNQQDVNGAFTLTIVLKRRVSSNDILSLSPILVQVHQQYIVNIQLLESVINHKCQFKRPFQHITHIPTSHRFCRQLMSRFQVI